jgi:hypothetical protein
MTTAAELKAAHLEQIKNYLKKYVNDGNDVVFLQSEADSFSGYTLTSNGLHTSGYGYFESSDGTELAFSLVDSRYEDSDKIYSTSDFYKHVQYDLASKLLNSIKE